jgi:hypothetical protein
MLPESIQVGALVFDSGLERPRARHERHGQCLAENLTSITRACRASRGQKYRGSCPCRRGGPLQEAGWPSDFCELCRVIDSLHLAAGSPRTAKDDPKDCPVSGDLKFCNIGQARQPATPNEVAGGHSVASEGPSAHLALAIIAGSVLARSLGDERGEFPVESLRIFEERGVAGAFVD